MRFLVIMGFLTLAASLSYRGILGTLTNDRWPQHGRPTRAQRVRGHLAAHHGTLYRAPFVILQSTRGLVFTGRATVPGQLAITAS